MFAQTFFVQYKQLNFFIVYSFLLLLSDYSAVNSIQFKKCIFQSFVQNPTLAQRFNNNISSLCTWKFVWHVETEKQGNRSAALTGCFAHSRLIRYAKNIYAHENRQFACISVFWSPPDLSALKMLRQAGVLLSLFLLTNAQFMGTGYGRRGMGMGVDGFGGGIPVSCWL